MMAYTVVPCAVPCVALVVGVPSSVLLASAPGGVAAPKILPRDLRKGKKEEIPRSGVRNSEL
jgi:hypothetical protein